MAWLGVKAAAAPAPPPQISGKFKNAFSVL